MINILLLIFVLMLHFQSNKYTWKTFERSDMDDRTIKYRPKSGVGDSMVNEV